MIEIIAGFTAKHSETKEEYNFEVGKRYSVVYSDDKDICIYIDDYDNSWEGEVEIPTSFENVCFEYIE